MSFFNNEDGKSRFIKFIIYFVSIVILTLICSPKIYKSQQIIEGITAASDIVSPKNFEISDNLSLQKQQADIYKDMKVIYKMEDVAPIVDDTILIKLNVSDKIKDKFDFIKESNRLIRKIFDIGYKEIQFDEKEYKNGISVISKRNNVIHSIEKSGDSLKNYQNNIIIGEDGLSKFIKLNSNIDNNYAENLILVLTNFVRPNIVIDNVAMLDEYNKIIRSITPAKRKVLKGETLIKKGELITKDKVEILKNISTYKWNTDIYLVILLFFTFIVLFIFSNYYFHFFISNFKRNISNYTVFFILLIIPAFLLKIYLVLINSSLFADKLFTYIFLIPIESSAILSVMMLFNRTGIIVALLTAFISSLVYSVYSVNTLFSDSGYSFLLGFTIFFSSMTGVFFMSQAKRRTNLLKSGFFISVSNIVFLFITEKLYSHIFNTHLDISFVAYIIIFVKGLLLTPSFVTGFMPIFESLFNLTTDYRLMELADISHPLLKELATKAPGTYQHSLTLANLSESAAQAIGANPLLARVGAYYHDIGKMVKPNYFIENQNYMENPHNYIKPSLSNSVLKAHVKQGLELADKWKLPKSIKDMIQQHHGKSLMIYFYNSALKSGEPVSESDYRYPGPTPNFKESAILSMADTIEAMTRTLKNPTPARISDMVNNAIKKKINDGDLDNSELTLKEIKVISETFIKILTTMYHTRIEYPDEKEIKDNEELSKKKNE
ncbi:HDIG domain-containing protein [Candidatus Dependentiae bacterium]|nr:HDIG domain-containing protein [Candidatus Dependentiae bacterium]